MNVFICLDIICLDIICIDIMKFVLAAVCQVWCDCFELRLSFKFLVLCHFSGKLFDIDFAFIVIDKRLYYVCFYCCLFNCMLFSYTDVGKRHLIIS